MKEINVAVIACITFFSGYCASFFFIGSEEGLNKVMSEYYTSFPLRVIGFTLFGLFWFTPLVVLNLITNTFFKQKASILKLIKFGVLVISIGSLVGTFLFYYGVLSS